MSVYTHNDSEDSLTYMTAPLNKKILNENLLAASKVKTTISSWSKISICVTWLLLLVGVSAYLLRFLSFNL